MWLSENFQQEKTNALDTFQKNKKNVQNVGNSPPKPSEFAELD